MRYMIDAGDSQVILYWSTKNHPENHYLMIAILLVVSARESAAASLNDLKIQLVIAPTPLSTTRCSQKEDSVISC